MCVSLTGSGWVMLLEHLTAPNGSDHQLSSLRPFRSTTMHLPASSRSGVRLSHPHNRRSCAADRLCHGGTDR